MISENAIQYVMYVYHYYLKSTLILLREKHWIFVT